MKLGQKRTLILTINKITANGNGNVSAKSSPGGSASKAFQRVNVDEWMGQTGSQNNSYEAAFGSGGWGASANAVLKTVRGKDFRHEKTKKKRGSYRGGAIDMGAVNSIPFDN